MKTTHNMIAAAVLLSVASAGAWAVAPADLGAQTYLRIGGATATDAALKSFFALDPTDAEVGGNAICQKTVPNTVDVYTQGGNDFVLSCLSTGNGGLPAAGTQIAIVKNSTGGSANGISPVSTARPAATLTFLNFTAAVVQAANCPITSNPGGSNGVQVYNVRTCTGITTTSVKPDAGISDVDPLTFVGTGGVTLADANGLPNISRGVQVVFAPIVSEGLYARLQTAEGLANDESLANMPTLSKPVLRGIFAGGSTALFDWDQVYVKNKTTGAMVRVGDGSASHPTIICRRGDSSGTMTSFKIHFLEQGCAKGSGIAKFISPDVLAQEATGVAWVEATHGSAIVFAGAGGGDARKCVSYGTISAGGGPLRNEWRIGILGTDNLPVRVGNAERFRYIRVDDQEPTLVATQEGRYDFFTENTLNDRGDLLGGTGQIWTFVKSNIGNRAAIAAANGAFLNAASLGIESNGAADTGVLAAPVPGSLQPIFPIVAIKVRSQLAADGGPVNSQSRTTPGFGINNCNNTMQVVP